ncbi:MAG: cell division protein ZapE [Alphaproteobacteria bacterium]|jgi:cell division protein ZapE
MSDGPLAHYRAEIAAGHLESDPVQVRAAEKLEKLYSALTQYCPGARRGWKARLGLARAEAPPRGLYFYGGVGRGKSMLMDLFFDTVDVPNGAKRRVHFHEFMLEVHARLHAWRRRTKDSKEADPLPKIAAEVRESAMLLCFDEFQVTNIADAMILARLFENLLELGVVVVATSNRAPDALYKDGLQRDRFMPFIALLKERLDVVHLDGELDYRLRRLRDMDVYFTPLNDAARVALDAAFRRLVDDEAGEGVAPEPVTLVVQGRELWVPAAARGTARFTFEELCARPLGAADYLAIARVFHTLIIEQIPVLSPESRDRAARFVILIDVLYEHRVKLVCSAEAAPDALYPAGDGSFDFARTASRLIEMQTKEYKALTHIAGSP